MYRSWQLELLFKWNWSHVSINCYTCLIVEYCTPFQQCVTCLEVRSLLMRLGITVVVVCNLDRIMRAVETSDLFEGGRVNCACFWIQDCRRPRRILVIIYLSDCLIKNVSVNGGQWRSWTSREGLWIISVRQIKVCFVRWAVQALGLFDSPVSIVRCVRHFIYNY